MDVDSAQLSLMQEGATLRRFPVKLGVSRSVQRGDTSTTGMPRGPFVVQRVLGPADPWPVPRWVYTDRRLAVPADSMVAGALGPVAILLEGGAVIYSQPAVGAAQRQRLRAPRGGPGQRGGPPRRRAQSHPWHPCVRLLI